MKKFLLLICVLFFGIANVFATHNRAGEITYKFIGDASHPFLYEITVTTYTNTHATLADRCFLMVYFGDGDSAIAPRINGVTAGTLCDEPFRDGQDLSALFPDTKLNIYKITHNYPGPLQYRITTTDPNRNEGTCNINDGGSVNIPFSIYSILVINPLLGPDDSPQLTYYPLDNACAGRCFYHNPGAFDVNGDSLYFTLDTCLMAPGVPALVWIYPPNMHYNDIDHHNGNLAWCAPTECCNYNIAILIKSYRRLPGNPARYFIGAVERDMQIEVECTCVNHPPSITSVDDTCITAGNNLHFTVTATDIDHQVVMLEGNGGPFHVSPMATFPTVSGMEPVSSVFNWTPNCNEVSLMPYIATFKATDNDAVLPLVYFKSTYIHVIAPAPVILSATPSGSSIIIDWDNAYCHDLFGTNPLMGYYIYRLDSCSTWAHDPCETGLPASTGYTLIGVVGPTITSFTDNNGGAGLTNGVNYSYIIVAVYSDGSQSYASNNVCAMLVRDVPIITNVSVISTGLSDTIWTHWIKPLGTSGNLDTIANPPPYEYRLWRATGSSTTYTSIASFTYSAYHFITDTGFVDTGLGTESNSYTYKVEFYSNSLLVGTTNTASSVYLSSTPLGNSMQLNWAATTPWNNYKYYIYRQNPPPSTVFTQIGTSFTPAFLDTGLVNGREYCYKVVTEGQYSDVTIPRPLYNTSQIRCDKPVDLIPPCQPTVAVDHSCGLFDNVLTWNNPNNTCSHDAVGYNVYFTPFQDSTLQVIAHITDVNTTSYTHIYLYEGVPSVAGCYAVTAIDTFNNESPIINKVCVDNCPEYELPNVFTPNGDGTNDYVTPLPGYRYVRDVDMKIYDRWGVVMFETSDLTIMWDGKNKDSKMPCSDGTYFYVCVVNEIRIGGITPRTLKGFIQLLHEKTPPAH